MNKQKRNGFRPLTEVQSEHGTKRSKQSFVTLIERDEKQTGEEEETPKCDLNSMSQFASDHNVITYKQ